MDVDVKDGCGCEGWLWMRRMDVDVKDGCGCEGWL